MLKPHGRKCRFEMVKMKEETEDELIASNRFPRDDEGEGKFYRVIERKGIDRCRNQRQSGLRERDYTYQGSLFLPFATFLFMHVTQRKI